MQYCVHVNWSRSAWRFWKSW